MFTPTPRFSREQLAQATFTDPHKQGFSLLALISNYKVKKNFACDHKFHTPSHLTCKVYPFLTARRRSKENLSIPGTTQENLCTHPLVHKIFVPCISIRNKKMKS